MSKERTYRNRVDKCGLVSFHVTVQETDLHLQAERRQAEEAVESVLQHLAQLDTYIRLGIRIFKIMYQLLKIFY